MCSVSTLDLLDEKDLVNFKYLIYVYADDACRLIVVLQENTYIYDINSLAILDTIDTVPNLKGNLVYSLLDCMHNV